jgi:flagellar protein FlgJ
MKVTFSNSMDRVISNSGSENPRLESAAHEFEASLMQELLKPLQHDSLFSTGEESEDDAGSNGALMSFGSQAMAKAISEHGGFGIAKKILDHFRTSPVSDARESAKAL